MFASTLFIPSISISFPIYRLLSDLGLKDTLTGVIFVYASLGIAVTFSSSAATFSPFQRKWRRQP